MIKTKETKKHGKVIFGTSKSVRDNSQRIEYYYTGDYFKVISYSGRTIAYSYILNRTILEDKLRLRFNTNYALLYDIVIPAICSTINIDCFTDAMYPEDECLNMRIADAQCSLIRTILSKIKGEV